MNRIAANKIDALREQEIVQLLNIIQRLSAHLAPELVAAIESEAAPHGQHIDFEEAVLSLKEAHG